MPQEGPPPLDELHGIIGEPRLSVDLGPALPLSSLGSLVVAAAQIVDHAHLALADFTFERAVETDSFEGSGSDIVQYSALLEFDRVLDLLHASASGDVNNPFEAIGFAWERARLIPYGVFAADFFETHVGDLVRHLSTMSPADVGDLVASPLFERTTLVVQALRREAALRLPEPLRVPPTQVDRVNYENPLAIDLIQGLPAGLEVGALMTFFVAMMKIGFGSGPRERAEADEIRSRIRNDSPVAAPTASASLVDAVQRVQLYDWQVE